MKRFASFSRRHLLTASLIVIVEVLFYRQYAQLGAEFHFWLHSLFGAALGIVVLVTWQLMRPRRPVRLSAWEAGAIGHLYSAVPDILFIAVGLLHMYWMDIFALHISLHFVRQPIMTMLALFLLALLAYGLLQSGRRQLSVSVVGVWLLVLSLSLLLRYPVPRNLRQLQQHNHQYAWLCPMWDLTNRTPQKMATKFN